MDAVPGKQVVGCSCSRTAAASASRRGRRALPRPQGRRSRRSTSSTSSRWRRGGMGRGLRRGRRRVARRHLDVRHALRDDRAAVFEGDGGPIASVASGTAPSVEADARARRASSRAAGRARTTPDLLIVCPTVADPRRAPDGPAHAEGDRLPAVRLPRDRSAGRTLKDEVSAANLALSAPLRAEHDATKDPRDAWSSRRSTSRTLNPHNWHGSCHGGDAGPAQAGAAPAGARLGAAPDADRRPLPDGLDHASRRVGLGRARPQRGDGDAARPRNVDRGGCCEVADERIEAAIAHWAPRFTSQGVDMNDFRARHQGLERWDQWLPAWAANGDMHTELALEAEAKAARAAPARRGCARRSRLPLREVRLDGRHGRHDDDEQRAIAAIANAHRHLDPTAERIEIPLDGFTMAGNLRRPPAIDAAAARPAAARARLDQGGVLQLGAGLPRPRPGDPVARRAGPGGGLETRPSARTTRSR